MIIAGVILRASLPYLDARLPALFPERGFVSSHSSTGPPRSPSPTAPSSRAASSPRPFLPPTAASPLPSFPPSATNKMLPCVVELYSGLGRIGGGWGEGLRQEHRTGNDFQHSPGVWPVGTVGTVGTAGLPHPGASTDPLPQCCWALLSQPSPGALFSTAPHPRPMLAVPAWPRGLRALLWPARLPASLSFWSRQRGLIFLNHK